MALVQAWLAVDYNTRPSLLPATDWTIGQWWRLVLTFVVTQATFFVLVLEECSKLLLLDFLLLVDWA
jgi:hypothetical protein